MEKTVPEHKQRRRTTFRVRLMVATTLLSVGVLVVTEGAVYLGARQALRVSLDGALLSIARSEIASAPDGPRGRLRVYTEGQIALAVSAASGYEKFAQIEDAQDRVVARTPNLMGGPAFQGMPQQEARARRGRIAFADVLRGRDPLRCIYYPFRDTQGRRLLAIIGVSRRPMQRSLESLAGLLGLSLLVGGGAAAAGASRLAQRLTQPLQDIAAAAQSVGESNLNARIPVFSPDAELQDVTTVLNDMLADLETAFSAQQALAVSQSRFIADASHELRSPLSNLRGTVEVALRRQRSAEEYQETLTVSLTEIERLSRIVADLLALSRADAGQFRPGAGLCDLSVVAAQAVAACSARAEDAALELSLAAGAPLPVSGDGDRLREAVDNLLDNALHYAPPHTRISVTTRREGERGCLSVQDAGPGLAEEEQARIFDRFYRADPSRTRRSGGTGLGLAIAKAFVEAHHGHITVQSRPGEGAAFTICVPLAPEEREAFGAVL